MPIDKKLLEQLKNKNYKKIVLDLSYKNLKDADIEDLIDLLTDNPGITELNLSRNQLTEKTVELLVDNTTIKTLRLKPGNPAISVGVLSLFLENTTLTALPFVGGGPDQQKLREHIKANIDRLQPFKKAAKPPAPAAKAKPKPKPKPGNVDIKDHADIESGKESFLQFAFNLLFDVEEFDSEKEYIIWYMAIALNLYMHNASHKPMPGYGKAQKLEDLHALCYSRSQIDHPNRIQHDRLAKTADDKRKISVSPINAVLRRLIAQTIQPGVENDDESKASQRLRAKREKLINILRSIDARRGFSRADKKIPNYFSLFLAHAGLRVNNFRVLINALEEVASADDQVEDITALRQKFAEQLPKRIPKHITKLDAVVVSKRIQAVQQRLVELKQEVDEMPSHVGLQKKILEQRRANNGIICEAANKIADRKNAFFHVEPNGPGCINVVIDKNKLNFYQTSSQAHIENFTNVILGFFQGLINYHARLAGFAFHVNRRQSFGFLNSTLTDAEELTLRLSLGVEPAVFNEIILSALKDLQAVLSSKKIFPKEFRGMRSEKKQWQAGFEAQYYLENGKSNVLSAFNNYLKEFIANDEKKVIKPEEFIQNNLPFHKPLKDQFMQTPLFAVLQNLIKYAINFAANFSAQVEEDFVKLFRHSYLHSLLKLYQHCHDALALLKKLDNCELSVAYKDANYHLQNIVEYLITLDSLEQIQEKMQGKANNRLAVLLDTERRHAKNSFNLVAQQVSVYLLDNGQQAITTSLLAMDFELFLQDVHQQRGQASIYNFNESYYELDLFLQDVGGLKNNNKAESTIVFIDITQLDKLKFREFESAKILVIDITRQPDLSDEQLKKTIANVHKLGMWVVLSASCLKHDELGTDKYTAGKIITLAPTKDEYLYDDVTDILEGVANHSMHPVVASYLQMINEICGDKMRAELKPAIPTRRPQLTNVAKEGMLQHGFLRPPIETKQSKKTIISHSSAAVKHQPSVR